jgi:hypothetical protein
MERLRAVDKYRNQLEDKYNSGVALYPFSWIYQYLSFKENKTQAETDAWEIVRTAYACRVGDVPGKEELLLSWEKFYKQHQRKGIAALEAFKAIPVDPTYAEWKAQMKMERLKRVRGEK